MKIKINFEKFGLTPAPTASKQMFDWFWGSFWRIRNNVRFETPVIETIDVKINQAMSYMDFHFYVTINGTYQYHISASKFAFEQFQKEKLKYEQMYDWGKKYMSRPKHFFEYTNFS